MKKMPMHALLMMSAFAFAWVLVEEVVARSLSQPYPLLQIVWCRYAVHLTLMLLLNISSPSRLWQTRRPIFHLARSLLMLVMPASFALSLQAGLPAGSVWAVFWIAPLLALGLASVVLREVIPPRTWLICGLGALAAVGMMAERATAFGPPLALPVIMAASFAGYVVMTRQLSGEPLQTNLFYTALGVFFMLTPIVPRTWVTPPASDVAVLVGIGAVGLAALWSLDRALAWAPVSASVPALYLHLPAVALVVWTTADSGPAPRKLLGSLLILTAVAWFAVAASRQMHLAPRRTVA